MLRQQADESAKRVSSLAFLNIEFCPTLIAKQVDYNLLTMCATLGDLNHNYVILQIQNTRSRSASEMNTEKHQESHEIYASELVDKNIAIEGQEIAVADGDQSERMSGNQNDKKRLTNRDKADSEKRYSEKSSPLTREDENQPRNDSSSFHGTDTDKRTLMHAPNEESTLASQSSDKVHKSSGNGQIEDEEAELTTVFETFWNICNTIQGLPILAIPYTFKVGGWWSMVTLLVVAVASNYTSIILVRSLYEDKDGVKVRVRSSYMEIGEAFWPNGGKWLVQIVMVIELIFVATLYPVLVGAMFAKSFPAIKLPLSAWTIIGGLALLPNTLLKNLSQVAWTSIITVVSAKIIFISIISYSVSKYHKWEIANLENFEAHAFPASVAILVSCYLAQPFVAFIESTMARPEKFEKTLNWAFIAMTTLNILIGLIAGVTFYPDTDEVITNNLPEGFFRQIVNAMAAILAFTSYTLPVFTAFDVVETSRSSCLAPNFGKNIYSCKVQILRLFMVLCTIFMAAAIPHYTFLLAVVGSMTGITLEFIFPALFHMKIYCTKLKWHEFALDITVVFIGTLVMTISLIVSWVSMYRCFFSHQC